MPYLPLVCASSRPASSAPVAARPATSPGRASSGTVSSGMQFGARRDLGRFAERDAGQAAVSAADRGLRDAGCRHHRVPGPGQHGTERRPHPAGPDDADPEPDRMPLSLRRGLARVQFRIHLVPVLTRYRTTAISISKGLPWTRIHRDLRPRELRLAAGPPSSRPAAGRARRRGLSAPGRIAPGERAPATCKDHSPGKHAKRGEQVGPGNRFAQRARQVDRESGAEAGDHRPRVRTRLGQRRGARDRDRRQRPGAHRRPVPVLPGPVAARQPGSQPPASGLSRPPPRPAAAALAPASRAAGRGRYRPA